MAKVKKTAAVTGVRNVKASKKSSRKSDRISDTRSSKRPVRKPGKKSKGAKRTTSKPTSRVKSLSAARAKATKAKARSRAPAPVVRVSVKPLEPQAKCGAGTSVQYLFRVDEMVDGRTSTHLVFFDRHGWYCEHGRNCPAVGHAKKYQGHIARAS